MTFLVGIRLTGSAFADAMEDGGAAFRSRHYDTAIEMLLPLAREGNVAAQVTVGLSYMYRGKYNDDLREAHKWLSPAAEQGFIAAQYNLGILYTHRYYDDYPEAVKWFRRAADQDYAPAQVVLGRILNGWRMPGTRGMPDDLRSRAEAFHWQQKAASQGYVEAYVELGEHYRLGRGVPKNLAEALKWIRLAAEHGQWNAYWSLARMYEKGEGVVQDNAQAYMWYDLIARLRSDKSAATYRDIIASRMTEEQIAESRRLTREWLAKHYQKP